MKQTRWKSLIAMLGLVSLTATAEEIKLDFSSPQLSAEMKVTRKAAVRDGVLDIPNGSNATLDVSKITNPCRISLRLKVTKNFRTKNPPYAGILFYGDSTQGVFYLHEKGIESYFYRNKKRVGGIGGKINIVDGEWYNLEFSVKKHAISFKLNDQTFMGKYTDLIPMKQILFNCYNLSYQIDDLKIIEEKEEKVETIEKPVLTFDFNGNTDGILADGKTLKQVSGSCHYVKGVDGQAVVVDKQGLSYQLAKPFFDSKVGGIMFWTRNLNDKGGSVYRFNRKNANKMSAGYAWTFNTWVASTSDKKGLSYQRTLPGSKKDWTLVTITWTPEGKAKYWVNMLPYTVSFTPGQRCPDFINADVNGLDELVFPSNRGGVVAIDRFLVFKREITNEDVYQEYRKFMPVDMVILDKVVVPEKTVKPTVQVAPGGFYTRPLPVARKDFQQAKVNLRFALCNAKGKELSVTEKTVNVTKPMDVELNPVSLKKGKYDLVVTVNGGYCRTFEILALSSDIGAAKPTAAGLKPGKKFYSRTFTNPNEKDFLKQGAVRLSADGKYLEMGYDKTDRLSFEITFPENVIGKPVALDITWPDDKPRTIGWYMYPANIYCNRDRLQSGVSAGRELPSSGKMVTTRHIFYPGVPTYLFESRTQAKNMPAALAKIEIYELPEGLPALKVHEPEGLAPRRFGFWDEDQTFTNNLNTDVWGAKKSPANEAFKAKFPTAGAHFTYEMVRYFRYTGMNTAHLPTWRYHMSYYPLEGQTDEGMFPYGHGFLPFIFDSFRKAGLKFIADSNLMNLQDVREKETMDPACTTKDMEMLDKFGDNIILYLVGNHKANFSHPEVRKRFVTYLELGIARYSKNPGFGGLQLSTTPITWTSLDNGYDDYNVYRFSREAGIKVPEKIKERYAFLTGKYRKQWLKWRAAQVTQSIREVREMLDKYNKALKLFIIVPAGIGGYAKDSAFENDTAYVEEGLDMRELKKIPRLDIVLTMSPTAYRHAMHWGRTESDINELQFDRNSKVMQERLVNGTAASVIGMHNYFETFVRPLGNQKKYNCYFEDADIKPHSRWYLRDLVYSVAAFDTLEYVAGGQPLPTIGRDEEAREFAQAYRALPAIPFTTVSGIQDPVTARYCQTKNGTYFYLANTFHADVKVSLSLPFLTKSLDLSTGKELTGSSFELKPFQLRSFLIKNKKVVPANLKLISVDPVQVKFYTNKIAELEKMVKLLKAKKIDVSAQEEYLRRLHKAFNAKQYAETFRLAFAPKLNQLIVQFENLDFFMKRQAMINRGHYAVNCGATAFYIAPDGRLFFPDQKFDGVYGTIGNSTSITRDIAGLHGTSIPEVYKTEAYTLDRYAFKLPNGKYNLIFHMKPGFKPNFQPKTYIFTVRANGKVILDKLDLHVRAKGDFTKANTIEVKNVEVTNGKLELKWNHEQPKLTHGSATVCLLNAIEVIPVKK